MSTSVPNILVLMADQLRFDWLGCAGTPGVSTPHIDALAARGVRFTRAVTNSAVCVPARVALASGIRPHRLGVLGNADVHPADVPTHYQALRDSGYRVGCVGKLDLDKPDRVVGGRGDRPQTFRWGFTHPLETEGKMHAGAHEEGHPLGPYGRFLAQEGLWEAFHADYRRRVPGIYEAMFDPSRPPGDDLHRDSVLPEHAFHDTWIAEQAVRWLERVPDEHPWHLFVSFVGPHDPFDPPRVWAERFAEAPVPDPVLDPGDGEPPRLEHHRWRFTLEEFRRARRQYTAALAAIDAGIGRVLDTLRSQRVLDDTIVVFTSDHGELLGDLGLFQKHFPYDPAMRVPLVIAGPGVDAATCDALVELVDLTATVLDWAGTSLPDVDGRTLRPLLDDPTRPHRDAVTCVEKPYLALRTGSHKYVHNLHAGPELYDLRRDPHERRNLADDDPDTAGELAALLAEELGRPLP